jgi:hypothetical protein
MPSRQVRDIDCGIMQEVKLGLLGYLSKTALRVVAEGVG